MIPWKYIDTTAATIAAIRDLDSMRAIADVAPEEIEEQEERLISPRSSKIDKMPHAHDPRAGENALAAGLDRLDVLAERNRVANEYLDWFEPAWDMLTDDEQLILTEFYGSGNQRSGANARLQQKINYSERTIEYMRSRAVARLALLLFGR